MSRLSWLICLVALLLVLLGLIGIQRCGEFSGAGNRYVWQQMIWLGMAVAMAVVVGSANYRSLGRWSYLLFLLAIGLLVAVYFLPPINGARRWIRLGPLGLQPSEFAKLAFVAALARYLMYRQSYRRTLGLLLPLAISLLPMLLILKEPDLGTSLIFVPVWFAMLWVAGARWIDLLGCVMAGLLLLPVLWQHMSYQQRSRVTALLEQTEPGRTPADDTFQLYQGKQMLALGGFWGSLVAGPAASDPAVYYLPEARCDFIFCVLGERLGIWGIGLMLLLFAILVALAQAVALATEDPFGRLLAAGLAALFAVQVLINTGMNVGLLPVTGLSLPLISYGGSGLLADGLAVGLLVSIARRPQFEAVGEPFRYVVR
jgi:cell division protein FtsW (lipid II flippase)